MKYQELKEILEKYPKKRFYRGDKRFYNRINKHTIVSLSKETLNLLFLDSETDYTKLDKGIDTDIDGDEVEIDNEFCIGSNEYKDLEIKDNMLIYRGVMAIQLEFLE